MDALIKMFRKDPGVAASIGRRKLGPETRWRRLTAAATLLLLALLALQSPALAHQLDEYLQATLVAIEPGEIRLQINLTPGVAVAEQVLGLIDRNRDGIISTNESAAYAELFRRDLMVRLDGRNAELKLASAYFPGPEELRTGWGFIQMDFTVTPGNLASGPHTLTLENRHLPSASVYLFNAAQPRSASVQIIGQTRNKNQSTGVISYELHPPPNRAKTIGIVALLAALCVVLFAGVWQARDFPRACGLIISHGRQVKERGRPRPRVACSQVTDRL